MNKKYNFKMLIPAAGILVFGVLAISAFFGIGFNLNSPWIGGKYDLSNIKDFPIIPGLSNKIDIDSIYGLGVAGLVISWIFIIPPLVAGIIKDKKITKGLILLAFAMETLALILIVASFSMFADGYQSSNVILYDKGKLAGDFILVLFGGFTAMGVTSYTFMKNYNYRMLVPTIGILIFGVLAIAAFFGIGFNTTETHFNDIEIPAIKADLSDLSQPYQIIDIDVESIYGLGVAGLVISWLFLISPIAAGFIKNKKVVKSLGIVTLLMEILAFILMIASFSKFADTISSENGSYDGFKLAGDLILILVGGIIAVATIPYAFMKINAYTNSETLSKLKNNFTFSKNWFLISAILTFFVGIAIILFTTLYSPSPMINIDSIEANSIANELNNLAEQNENTILGQLSISDVSDNLLNSLKNITLYNSITNTKLGISLLTVGSIICLISIPNIFIASKVVNQKGYTDIKLMNWLAFSTSIFGIIGFIGQITYFSKLTAITRNSFKGQDKKGHIIIVVGVSVAIMIVVVFLLVGSLFIVNSNNSHIITNYDNWHSWVSSGNNVLATHLSIDENNHINGFITIENNNSIFGDSIILGKINGFFDNNTGTYDFSAWSEMDGVLTNSYSDAIIDWFPPIMLGIGILGLVMIYTLIGSSLSLGNKSNVLNDNLKVLGAVSSVIIGSCGLLFMSKNETKTIEVQETNSKTKSKVSSKENQYKDEVTRLTKELDSIKKSLKSITS